jgi:acetate kinase
MVVITINAGSTSVRLAAFDVSGAEPRELVRERRAGRDFDAVNLLREFADRVGAVPQAVAHRVVHGGTEFVKATLVDTSVQRRIAELSPLAPLHNPVALSWIDAARAAFGANTSQVALFDTAFFTNLPARSARYAIPAAFATTHGVRRYGFHGLAHEAMWLRWCELRPDLERGGRLVTLQLGGGCSIAAIALGRPVDTSMGFTPLEGLVMATRCGDIDAAIVPYLSARLGESGERVVERLNRESGLLGVSGQTADLSALLRDDSAAAQLAVDMFCSRARKYVGAYLALLGGCDGIVFGGGLGENVAEVRTHILGDMEWAGISLDRSANTQSRVDKPISAPTSAIEVHVVRVDEEAMLARGARGVLSRP